MTLGRMLRPVLVCLGAVATSSCGMVEGDPHRFESVAQHIADIRLDGSTDAPAQPAPILTAAEEGLRPALAPSGDGRLKVQVMDPHDLWDARDGLKVVVAEAGSRAAEAAAPVVAEAVVQRVSARILPGAPMRPAMPRPAAQGEPAQARTTIQLGAYSSPEAARAAWADISGGAARGALAGLSPVFEAVQVNGRPLTRLRVAAPAAAAVAICRAAEVSDPWCARRA